ncbi:phenylacetate--CoA ligase family protein [Nocardia sp. NPDC057227]|uniref:phenylacetate--CoA ligase family protein n=1 Tax=Nocardia sp. NPDC057227 TaxID=3346056 RepID=UPI0036453778
MSRTTRPGFARALRVFQLAATHVPAYAPFLAEHEIDPRDIRTPADFAQLPPMTEPGYFEKYPRHELLADGVPTVFWSRSSGRTGYRPLDAESRARDSTLHRRILRPLGAHERSTLVVVTSAIGSWVGDTVSCLEALAAQGFPVSVVTPEQNPDAVRADIAALGPAYDQVVIFGHPPFVRDVLDGAGPAVLNQDLKIVMAGENISERWRDLLLGLLGKPGAHADTCLIYGTAGAGLVGHETPTTIGVRRLAKTDPRLRKQVFGAGPVLPTFVEFDPRHRYLETDDDGRLLVTVAGPMPLVRYRTDDEGHLLSAARLAAILRLRGHDLRVRTCSPGSAFLVLHGRSDIAATSHAVRLPILRKAS